MRDRGSVKVIVFLSMAGLLLALSSVAMAEEAKPAPAPAPAAAPATPPATPPAPPAPPAAAPAAVPSPPAAPVPTGAPAVVPAPAAVPAPADAAKPPEVSKPPEVKPEPKKEEKKSDSKYGANAVMLNVSNIGLTIPLGMTWVQGSYYRRIWGPFGASIEPLYFGIDKSTTQKMNGQDVDMPFSLSGFGASLGFPIYPFSGEAVHGFYLKPRLSFLILNGTIGASAKDATTGLEVRTDKEGSLNMVSFGASIGWLWQWQFGLVIGFELIGAEYALPGGDLGDMYVEKMPISILAHIWPVLPSLSLGWSF